MFNQTASDWSYLDAFTVEFKSQKLSTSVTHGNINPFSGLFIFYVEVIVPTGFA